MVNKKSVWFLTLFSLILVLSVYYITMPSELLFNTNSDYTKEVTKETTTTEKTVLVALRVKSDDELTKEMEDLKVVLTNEKTSMEEKNKALDKMKDLNVKRGEEEALEKKIKTTYNLECFIKIKNDRIEVVANKKEHDTSLANDIIRSIQENYKEKMYITVKFTS